MLIDSSNINNESLDNFDDENISIYSAYVKLKHELEDKNKKIEYLLESNKKWERDEREASIKIDQLEQRAHRAEQENIRLQNLNQRRK